MRSGKVLSASLGAASWLFVPPPAAYGQWTPFKPDKLVRIQAGIREVYSLDYDRAAQRFQAMIRESPDDPAGYAYLALTYWVQELSSKQELSIDRFDSSYFSELPKNMLKVDPSVEARLRNMSQKAIDRAEAKLSVNPRDSEARYLLGLAHQNLCSFEASLRRSWVGAFKHGGETYENHKRLLEQNQQFSDARLATGVYHYVLASLPWYYKVLVLLLGRRGDKEEGKKDLLTAAQKGVLAADDARLMLILIYTREKDYGRAMALLSELYQKYPQNYLIPLDIGGMALLRKQPDRAIEAYRDILRKHQSGAPHFNELEATSIYNRLAVAYRSKKDFTSSESWSRKALAEKAASQRALTLARLEYGKTLDLMGRRSDALKQYQIVAAADDVAGSALEAQQLQRRAFAGG